MAKFIKQILCYTRKYTIMKNKGIARRNFLKYGTAIAAGTLVSGPLMASTGKNNGIIKKDKQEFITRKLGNTGLELPIVSMGVMRSDQPQVVIEALKKGIKHFDTAAMYSDGKNEEMLGKVFKKHKRKSFTIATKVHPGKFDAYDRKTGVLGDNFEEGFIKTFNGSLERLQMEYVDILYMHAIEHAEAAFDKRALKVMKQMKDEGKTKHLGISTHHPKEILKAVIEKGFYEVVLIAINAKQAEDQEYFELIKQASEKGIGIVAMKTMMGGYYDKAKTKQVNGKAALKWVMKNEYIHTSIPGIKTFTELEENISIMNNLDLNEEEKVNLEMAYSETGLFCTNCDECLSQCKKNLAIPGLMRAYMYAYGYGETKKAQEQFNDFKGKTTCTDCDQCIVNCPNGLDVAQRIKDISRIEYVPEEFLS